MNPIVKKKSGTSHTTVPVGAYVGTFTGIRCPDEYIDNDVIEVTYLLEGDNGCTYEFKELFHNRSSNDRTRQFFEYLNENSIPFDPETGLPDLVGRKEKIVIKLRVSNRGQTWPTIAERDFI